MPTNPDVPMSREERDSLVCDCGDILEANLTERLKAMKRGQERRFASLIASVVRERENQVLKDGAVEALKLAKGHLWDFSGWDSETKGGVTAEVILDRLITHYQDKESEWRG